MTLKFYLMKGVGWGGFNCLSSQRMEPIKLRSQIDILVSRIIVCNHAMVGCDCFPHCTFGRLGTNITTTWQLLVSIIVIMSGGWFFCLFTNSMLNFWFATVCFVFRIFQKDGATSNCKRFTTKIFLRMLCRAWYPPIPLGSFWI